MCIVCRVGDCRPEESHIFKKMTGQGFSAALSLHLGEEWKQHGVGIMVLMRHSNYANNKGWLTKDFCKVFSQTNVLNGVELTVKGVTVSGGGKLLVAHGSVNVSVLQSECFEH